MPEYGPDVARRRIAAGEIKGGSGSDLAGAPPGATDGGLSSGVIHTAAQESGIRQKAAAGGVITNDDMDPRGYLGHFGSDSVLTKGHNVGHKKLGKAPLVKGVAPKGYRVLPGSASKVQGHARFGTPSDAELDLRPPRAQRAADARAKHQMTRAMNKAMNGSHIMQHDPTPLGAPGGKPRAVTDVKLSIRHHKDSIAYNTRHAVDHEREAAKHKRELKGAEQQLRRKKR